MFRNFSRIKFKIRTFDISSVRREFLEAIGKGYSIRASTSQKTFYTVLESTNEILVNLEAMRVEMTFPLNPFMIAYFNASSLTLIHLTLNS